MKKFLSTIAAIALSGLFAYGASLPSFTGPQDPSQLNATLNQLNSNINAGVNGVVATAPATFATIATTVEQTLATMTIPANTLAKSGQALRLRCSGYINGNASTSSAWGIRFGTAIVSSQTTAVQTGQSFDLDLQVTYNASSTSTNYVGRGTINASPISIVATTNTVDNMAANQTASCLARQTSSQTAGSTLINFVVEQIK